MTVFTDAIHCCYDPSRFSNWPHLGDEGRNKTITHRGQFVQDNYEYSTFDILCMHTLLFYYFNAGVFRLQYCYFYFTEVSEYLPHHLYLNNYVNWYF